MGLNPMQSHLGEKLRWMNNVSETKEYIIHTTTP
jgi:hypothetical protein